MTNYQASLSAPAAKFSTSPSNLRRAGRRVRRLGAQAAFLRKPKVELNLTPDMLG
jgi:hypothetical protein